MDASEVLEELPVNEWHGPFPRALRERAIAALENGRVLFLPMLPFRIEPAEARFLAPEAAGGERKNISFEPATGQISNTAVLSEDVPGLTAMIERFGRYAARLLADLLPAYTEGLERARTSFRPVEIQGRATSPRHDDRLLHVDAFPTRPMRGRRILRVFSNVAPDGAGRDWAVGEPFANFAEKFIPRTTRGVPGSAWVQERLGLTKGRRSAYDQIMLRLHDSAKLDAAYQRSGPKAAVTFPAGSSWICFTDQVLHAALAGHCALEQTFHLPVEVMADPARSPLRVLEGLAGRKLV